MNLSNAKIPSEQKPTTIRDILSFCHGLLRIISSFLHDGVIQAYCQVGGLMGLLFFIIFILLGITSIFSMQVTETIVFLVVLGAIYISYSYTVRIRNEYFKRADFLSRIKLKIFLLAISTCFILFLTVFIINIFNIQNPPAIIGQFQPYLNNVSEMILKFFLLFASPLIFLPLLFSPTIVGGIIYYLFEFSKKDLVKSGNSKACKLLIFFGLPQILIYVLFAIGRFDWLMDLIFTPIFESSISLSLAKYFVGLPALGFWRVLRDPLHTFFER